MRRKSSTVELLERRRVLNGELFPNESFVVPTQLRDVVTADMNRDGKADVVAALHLHTAVGIALGNGEGGIGTWRSIQLGSLKRPDKVVVGDLNSDQWLDIVATTASDVDGYVIVLLSDGRGDYQAPRTIALSTPLMPLIADVDGDSFTDLVVTQATTNALSIYKGDGAGNLASARTYSTGSPSAAVSVHAVDLNGDGRPELVTGNRSGWNLSILMNLGVDGFSAPAPLALGRRVVETKISDLNQDGLADIVAANDAPASVSVYLGTGQGQFSAPANYAYSGTATPQGGLVVRDFSGDGRPDVVTADSTGEISYFKANANGTLGTANRYVVGFSPTAIDAADFDNDGSVDVITTNQLSFNLQITRGDPDMGFVAATSMAGPVSGSGMVTRDFNGDGYPDLAWTDSNQGRVQVRLATANGSFAAATNYTVGTSPISLIAADVNADGILDLVASVYSISKVAVLRGLGDGRFATAFTLGVDNYPMSVILADVNLDGFEDLLSANYTNGTISVLLRDSTVTGPIGVASYLPAVNYPAGSRPTDLLCRDFNHDGVPDILVTQSETSHALLLAGQATGGFAAPTLAANLTWSKELEIADFNRDGVADLAIQTSAYIRIYLDADAGWNRSGIEYFLTSAGGRFVVGDLNRDGILDIVSSATSYGVYVGIGRGDGTFYVNPYTFRQFAGGSGSPVIADFNRDGWPDIASFNANTVVIHPNLLVRDSQPPAITACSFDVGGTAPKTNLKLDEIVGLGSIDAAKFSAVNLRTGITYRPTAVTLSPTGRELELLWDTTLADGTYRFVVEPGAMRDLAGVPIGSSTYDSANYVLLRGDANGDRVVDFGDVLILAQQYGRTGRTFSQGNFDYDPLGAVDFVDLLLLAQNFSATPAARAPAARARPRTAVAEIVT